MSRAKTPPVDRLLAGTQMPSSFGACWLWTGCKTIGGYAQIGKGGDGGGNFLGHRLSFVLAFGPIPEGMELDHLCNTRHCVNPLHLEAVTHAVNMRRARDRRETCSNGHSRSEKNTRWEKSGNRKCRPCGAEQSRRVRAKKRSEAK